MTLAHNSLGELKKHANVIWATDPYSSVQSPEGRFVRPIKSFAYFLKLIPFKLCLQTGDDQYKIARGNLWLLAHNRHLFLAWQLYEKT